MDDQLTILADGMQRWITLDNLTVISRVTVEQWCH